ncbi:nucleoid-associated protein [Cytophagaceae bacterium ABcell3]|nr:nucleoid-associated protein [Cytophagaceae bacterium ABcell3]
MLDFTKAHLKNLCIHKIGNRVRNEDLVLSNDFTDISDTELNSLLKNFFLSSIPKEEHYQFSKEDGIVKLISAIFEEPQQLLPNSRLIAEHLYEISRHPKIKGGELCIAYFTDCVYEDELIDAIGIFKSENKQKFLKIYTAQGNIGINKDEGIDIHKLDKGCLIFNTFQEEGYIVNIIDKTNKADEASFWKDDFLGLSPIQDEYHNTQNYLKVCKDFISGKLKEEKELSRTDEIELLNQSFSFFQEKENFNMDEFNNEVIKEPEVIDAFKEHKKNYEEQKSIVIADEFAISPVAVKKSGKYIRSVLKLDSNFHIYIHGNKERIEKGYDEGKGMNFYKFYYEDEE